MKLIISTLLHALLLAGLWQPEPMVTNVTVLVIWIFSIMTCIAAMTIIGGDDEFKRAAGMLQSHSLYVWSLVMALVVVVSLAAHGWLLTAGFLLFSRMLTRLALRAGSDAVEKFNLYWPNGVNGRSNESP